MEAGITGLIYYKRSTFMNTVLKLFAACALTLSLLGVYTPAALAAPPANDLSSGATAVTIGYSETIDTSEATTDAEDYQLNVMCGAPATDASVWYTLVGTDQGVIVDVSSSNYSAGVLVGTGSPGALDVLTCGPGSVAFYAAAGATYYILAIDDQLDGSGNGGQLSISFNEIPPPPVINITIDPYGKVNTRSGVATVTGTYTCSGGDFLEVYGDATQEAGRFTVLGNFYFSNSGTCDGTARKWSAAVYPNAGKFAGGKAMTVTLAYACGVFECGYGYTEQVVILQGKK
jgi:hypothetical protein